MGRVCLRAARIGLFLGCVGAAHHAYAIPRQSTQAPQVTQPPPPSVQAPILQQLSIEGATVYSRDDVLWLLGLREGAPLTDSADAIARTLQENGAYLGDNSGSSTQIKASQASVCSGTNLSTDCMQGKVSFKGTSIDAN